jgi:uncharacterized SAM-binding protein YcdF (DUF218 family)
MQTETTTPERTRPPRRRRVILFVLLWLVLATGVALIYLTYAWFANPATADPGTVEPADAVVLFAGVEDRLETALSLMEQGVAPNLVLPAGPEIDDADGLCDGSAGFMVFCPPTDEASTIGEARAIGRLAAEQGWSRLIAVTSVYHVHRATYLLDRCHEGPIVAVTPDQTLDRDDIIEKSLEEWIGYLGSVVLQPSC